MPCVKSVEQKLEATFITGQPLTLTGGERNRMRSTGRPGSQSCGRKIYTANNWIRDTNGCRMMRPSGTFMIITLMNDAFDSNLYYLRKGFKILEKYSPPILDCDYSDWVASYNCGHFAHCEIDFPLEKNLESYQGLMKGAMEIVNKDLSAKEDSGLGGALGAPFHNQAGSVFGYGRLLRGIKRAIDPQNVSNPPHPISITYLPPQKKSIQVVC